MKAKRPNRVGSFDQTQPAGGGDRAAVFRVPLLAGSTRVRTWLDDERGGSRGAYYVYARRLS